MPSTKLSVCISSFPGLAISVPYEEDEPLCFVRDRVSNCVYNTTACVDPEVASLYLDGRLIHNYSKSMEYYSIFGSTITYKSATPSSFTSLTIGAQALEEAATQFITVNVLTVSGQDIAIQILAQTTVETLKQEIAQTVLEVLPVEEQRLYHQGSELQNNQTLVHYNVKDDTTIYMLTQLPRTLKIPILIECPRSETAFVIHTDFGQTIHAIKVNIMAKQGIPIDQQRLVFDGKNMKNERTLSDYHVHEQDMLLFVPRPPPDTITRFADIATDRAVAATSTDTGPSGRMVTSGINIELKCSCTPDHDVINMLGTGFYEVGEELECPNCRSIDVIQYAVGFVDCAYRTHGVMLDWTHYKSDWKEVAGKDRYQRLELSEQTSWKRLGFEVELLHRRAVLVCTICLEDVSSHC